MSFVTATLSATLMLSLGWIPSGVRWEQLPQPYCISGNSQNTDLSSADQVKAIEKAIHQWFTPAHGGDVSCTRYYGVPAAYSCSATPGQAADGQRNIFFVGGEDWGYGRATLGITRISHPVSQDCGTVTDNTQTQRRLSCTADADIMINDRDYRWRTDGQNTDLTSVVTHEYGHFFGLDHCNDNGTCRSGEAIMYAAYAGPQLTKPQRDDILGVCSLYPAETSDRKFGDACDKDEQCADRICAEGGYCTRTCGSCPAGYHCGPNPKNQAQQICLLDGADPSLGADLCGVCDGGPSSCKDEGLCVGGLSQNQGEGRCITACNAEHPCPAHYQCTAIRVGSNSGDYCIPESQKCDQVPASKLNESCTDRCETGLGCFRENPPALGLCRPLCKTHADCGQGEACGDYGKLGRFCNPAKPVGSACEASDLCENGACHEALCRLDCTDNTAACPDATVCQQVAALSRSLCLPKSDTDPHPPGPGTCACDQTQSRCDPNCSCDPDCQPAQDPPRPPPPSGCSDTVLPLDAQGRIPWRGLLALFTFGLLGLRKRGFRG